VRCVLDTDVVVAAMRSPKGASAALLLAALDGRIELAANVALVLEYESVCLRDEHRLASGLAAPEVQRFVDGVAALVHPVTSHFVWRPQLKDPGDEMVLEAAVNGMADAIVTFNQRDFDPAASRFGVQILLPRDVLMALHAPQKGTP
jgi:putative PIN family toxin of toxin-antitoxin system